MIDLTDGACSGDGELAHEKTPGPAWGAGGGGGGGEEAEQDFPALTEPPPS
jgi:hypothetical protein